MERRDGRTRKKVPDAETGYIAMYEIEKLQIQLRDMTVSRDYWKEVALEKIDKQVVDLEIEVVRLKQRLNELEAYDFDYDYSEV